MIWSIADTHFGHKNIIKYCNRPFQFVEEMDATMIQNWNSTVQQDDYIYHLGDFGLGGEEYFRSIVERLNGHINLVPGSHDRKFLQFIRDFNCPTKLQKVPEITEIKSKEYHIVLCHYAMRRWPRSHYGSMHLYGHSHGRLEGLGRSMDVGVDANYFKPVSIDSVIQKLSSVEFNVERS